MSFGPFTIRLGGKFFVVASTATATDFVRSLDEDFSNKIHWQNAERRLGLVDHGTEMVVHADEAFHHALRLEGWLYE